MAGLNISSSTLQKGTFVATVSAVCYGFAVIFVRYAYQAGVLPVTAAFLRYGIATVIMILFLSLTGYSVKLPLRRAMILLSLGIFMYALAGITWVTALNLISDWLVSLITALHPLLVTLGSCLFLRERLQWPQFLALAAVLLGSAFLFWRPFEGAAWAGILVMSLNVLISAVYILVGQRLTQGIPPLTSTAWFIGGGMIGTYIYGALSQQLSFSFAPSGWMWMTLFASVSTVIAATLLWWGVGLIGPSRVAIIGSFEPVMSIILAVSLLDERLIAGQVIGGAFIIAGMFLVQWRPQNLRARPHG